MSQITYGPNDMNKLQSFNYLHRLLMHQKVMKSFQMVSKTTPQFSITNISFCFVKKCMICEDFKTLKNFETFHFVVDFTFCNIVSHI